VSDPRLVVAVPFYVSRPDGYREGDAVFDHPTPLGGPPTLPRLLESLSVLEPSELAVVVLVGHSHADVAAEADRFARELVSAWRAPAGIDVRLLGAAELSHLTASLPDHGGLLELCSYQGVRNLCLAAAKLTGADAAVLLDDDEEVTNADLARRLASPVVGPDATAEAMAGLYLEQGTDIVVEPTPQPWSDRWDPARHKIDAFHEALSRGGAGDTAFAFGGNLAVSDRLLTDLPFDPNVTRGEDIDYVVSARLLGHRVQLDPSITLSHYPPPRPHPQWRQLREDGRRFLHQKRKLDCAIAAGIQLPAGALDPYPGRVLTDDLTERLCDALTLMATEYDSRVEPEHAQSARAAADHLASLARALEQRDPWAEYLTSAARWRELTTHMATLGPRDDLLAPVHAP